MSRRALVLDGLWYSLCPSFTALSVSRSTAFPKAKARSQRLYPVPSISSPSSGSRRCYNTSGGDSYKVPYNATYHNDRGEAREPRESEYRDAHLSPDPTYRPPTRRKSPLYTRTHKVQDDLLGKTNEGLESRLQYAMDNKPNIRHITQILRLLIRDRHVQPNARHYKALILANTDNERGSPQLVRGLLEEMENNGITADSGTLHGALQVGFLVEPSYMYVQSKANDAIPRVGPCCASGLPPTTGNPQQASRPVAHAEPSWVAFCGGWSSPREPD